MKSRLLGAGIGLILIVLLIFVVFGSKNEKRSKEIGNINSIKELILRGELDEAKGKIQEASVKFSDEGAVGKIYFDLAKAYEKKGELVKARDAYTEIFNRYQNVDNILEVQESLSKLNIDILFSSIITDKDALYEVEPGDTLSKIAKKFGTTIELIKTSNSLKSDTILAHSKLKVSKNRYKILIDKSQNLLTILSDDNALVKAYRVSTGENNSTPAGVFKIVNRIKDPVWYTEGAIVPAESPDNILGSRWLGFSEPGYGIHGTIDPDSVGRQATKGCIRMLNADVEELFAIVPVGTEVTIAD